MSSAAATATAGATTAPTYEWVPLERNYDLDKDDGVKLVEVSVHPLIEDKPVIQLLPGSAPQAQQAPTALTSAPAPAAIADPLGAGASTFSDPLSGGFVDPLGAAAPVDPLGATAKSKDAAPAVVTRSITSVSLGKKMDNISYTDDSKSSAASKFDDDKLNWSLKKAGILSKYTTTEAISIPSFVSGVSKVGQPVDKVKARLEQLEQFEDEGDSEMLSLTAKDYIKHIEKMHADLIQAWNTEQRVKSLKIAIKLSKILGETSEVTGFYPSKWVLITEILDTFGQLVWNRIKERATVYDGDVAIPLKDNFRAEDVADHAQETCKNWFFKIASIREMLPRLYIELSIMKCYAFIYNDYYPTAIKILSRVVRGIGDPLVAMYARAYLARRAHEFHPHAKEHLVLALDDYIFLQRTFTEKKMQLWRESKNLSLAQYLDLYTPALEWLVQCLAYRASDSLFRETMEKFREDRNGAVLNAIISAFDAKFIAANAAAFVELIKASDPTTFERHELYKTLGMTLVQQPASTFAAKDKDAQALFNSIWSEISQMTDAPKYISAADVLIEFPAKFLTLKATNAVLDDISKHVLPDRKFVDLQPQLQSIVTKLLADIRNFVDLFQMDSFVPFLDLFRGATQIDLYKSVLAAFAKTPLSPETRVSDPMIMNTLFNVSKVVHDSVNALSFQDEVRRINKLIVAFIQRIDFGNEVEKQLNFYVECRRAFANLDSVKANLVRGVAALAMRTHNIVGGKHNKETSAFVRACIAYCYISIPSMDDPFARLHLYVMCGQVALMNQSLPQAESLFKAAITLIQEVPVQVENKKDGKMRSSEPELVEFIHTFVAALVAVPGHPEFGPFYLVRGLQKVVQEYPFSEGTSVRAEIYTSMLALLSTAVQSNAPYQYANVDGNNVLYGGTVEYEQEIQEYINQLIVLIQEEVAVLRKKHKETGMKTKKAKVCTDLFNRVLVSAKLNPNLATLCFNNWDLAKKNKTHSVYRRNSVAFLKRKAIAAGKSAPIYAQLFQKIQQTQPTF